MQFFPVVVFSNIHESVAINKNRMTRIVLESLPSQRYRRQAVRNNLDIVGESSVAVYFPEWKMLNAINCDFIWFFTVSVGGIMGLFLGASILSVVEFIYFFTVRLFGTYQQQRHAKSIRTAPDRWNKSFAAVKNETDH